MCIGLFSLVLDTDHEEDTALVSIDRIACANTTNANSYLQADQHGVTRTAFKNRFRL
jgi:hypothetical protein